MNSKTTKFLRKVYVILGFANSFRYYTKITILKNNILDLIKIKNDIIVSYKAKHILNHKPYDTAIPLLGHLSKRNENVCPYKNLYIVFIAAIPKSPQRETILMSINW